MMKKVMLYMLLILGNLSFFTACFDDKSTSPDHPIPDIVIDTTGIPESFKIVQGERLVIQPNVVRDNGDASDLSYKWMLNTIATTTQMESPNYSNYICVGEGATLDTAIYLPSNEQTYFLWFQVTDNKTQLRKDCLWKVLVLSAYNEGILIADTKDGRTTDFSLIEGKQFTEGWTSEAEKISHNLYSCANGTAMEGLVKQICHSYNSNTRVKAKRFYCIGDDFYALVDGREYELVGRNFDVVYDDGLSIKPQQMFYCRSNVVLVNDGDIYPFSAGLARDYPNIHIPMGFSVEVEEKKVTKTSKVDKYVAFTHQTSGSYPWGVWYDKSEGRFLCQTSSPYVKTNIGFLAESDEPFDPNNVPGLETVYAAIGLDDNFYMIMRNTTTNAYQIYVIERTTSKAKYLYDIPGHEMDEAVGFAVSEDGNIVYFATPKEVYAIVLGGVSPQVNLLYTIPSGEITHFSMFRQAWYLMNPRSKTPIDTHEHLLLTGVWDGSNGTLYTIPIANPAAGTIRQGDIKTYSGFGKILTIVSQQ